MRAVTSAQIAELDRRATEQYGIPVERLMEEAGRRVAQAALDLNRAPAGVVVLAGKGNNGGDGLVAARYLAASGVAVTALLTAPEHDYRGEARRTLSAAKAAGASVVDAAELDAPGLSARLQSAGLIIDALFGTGFTGPARGTAAALIEAANASGTPILAVDLPSGLDADTGRAEGPVIRAAATVTMGLPKVGLLVYPGADLAGRIYVADIGYPPDLAEDPSVTTYLVTSEMVRVHLPPRPADSHKGTYGRTLIIAGSVGFTGAPVLAARGALRVGGGLVTLTVPHAVYPIVAAHLIEAMPAPVDEESGALAASSLAKIEEYAGMSDAIAAGPGLSQAPGVRRVVEGLLRRPQPLVIDADGLNVLAGHADLLRQAAGPLVITPHPGELARLIGKRTPEVLHDRVSEARAAAARFHCVVVLKSATTVIATPGAETYLIRTGNAGMATGGMGDVLTGVIASFIGQGVPPTTAAWMGAYLHGLAADLILEERGMVGMLASEVADHLPAALARIRRGEQFDAIRHLRD